MFAPNAMLTIRTSSAVARGSDYRLLLPSNLKRHLICAILQSRYVKWLFQAPAIENRLPPKLSEEQVLSSLALGKAGATMAHRQPRGHKIAQLISEYERRTCLPCGSLCSIDGKNRLVADVPGVPRKSKLLAFSDNKGGSWEKLIQPFQKSSGDCACGYEAPSGRCARRWLLIGVFRSPSERHRQACLLPFPMDQAQAVRPWQAAILVRTLKMSPANLVNATG